MTQLPQDFEDALETKTWQAKQGLNGAYRVSNPAGVFVGAVHARNKEDAIRVFGGLSKTGNFTMSELEAAVGIANIAGSYGYEPLSSCNTKSLFISWALEWNSTKLEDEHWQLEQFAAPKLLTEVATGRARFDESRLPAWMVSALVKEKNLLMNSTGDRLERSVREAMKLAEGKLDVIVASTKCNRVSSGKIIGVTDMHVVQSIGRIAVVYSKAMLDVSPRKDEEVTIDFKNGYGAVIHEKKQEIGIGR